MSLHIWGEDDFGTSILSHWTIRSPPKQPPTIEEELAGFRGKTLRNVKSLG